MPSHRSRRASAVLSALPVLVALACGGTTTGKTGGDAGAEAGVPAYAVCDGPGQCAAKVPGCCGVCGAPTLEDVSGVNVDHLDDFKAATCKDPNPTCPKCAQMNEPNLVAFCTGGQCTPLDVRRSEYSACASDADCVLREATCCSSCAPTISDLIAVAAKEASAFSAELCRPDQACPACVPVYPPEAAATCGKDGHCAVTERTNVCPEAEPVMGTECALAASLVCEYGNEIRPGCRNHATCVGGVWQIAISGCKPLPGPGEAGCPVSEPAGGSSCTPDGLICDMGGDTVCACAACAGLCSPFPLWSCAGPPTTPGCPSRAPALGSACSEENLSCTYGPLCIPMVSVRRTCTDGAWVDEPMACPV